MRSKVRRVGIVLLQFISTNTALAGGAPEPPPSGLSSLMLIVLFFLLLGVTLVVVKFWRGQQRSDSHSRTDHVESASQSPLAQARSGRASSQTDTEKQSGVSPINPSSPQRAPSAALGTVFISYRRAEGSDVAGRIYDRLI